MNALADPFKQLVERKLWPVALLLVAALVAVPLMLKSEAVGEDAMPASLAATEAGQGSTEPVVSLGDDALRDEVRAVLGSRKDPFRPAQIKPVPTPEVEATAPAVQPQVDGGASSGGPPSGGAPSGGAPGAGAPAPAPPVGPAPDPAPVDPDPTAAPTPDAPEPTFELHSLVVRFGDTASGDLQTRTVKRLTGLPGSTSPAALYLGLSEGKDSAVFLIDAGVGVIGDGRCDPTPANCQTLILEPGETVFLTRGGKQWELDLIRINTRRTTDESAARRARTEVARGGRRALKRMRSVSSYRYSQTSGTVRKVPGSARGLRSTAQPTGVANGFTSAG